MGANSLFYRFVRGNTTSKNCGSQLGVPFHVLNMQKRDAGLTVIGRSSARRAGSFCYWLFPSNRKTITALALLPSVLHASAVGSTSPPSLSADAHNACCSSGSCAGYSARRANHGQDAPIYADAIKTVLARIVYVRSCYQFRCRYASCHFEASTLERCASTSLPNT